MSQLLKGIGVSAGIASAKAFRWEEPDLSVAKKEVADKEAEKKRLDDALQKSISELQKIKKYTAETLGKDKAAIFEAHLLVLSDPELIGPVKKKINDEGVNAEFAIKEVADRFVSLFESMSNEYMRERAADIRDITKRVIGHLLGVKIPNPSLISEEVIIIAEDLTPSAISQLNRQFVKGFITNSGGRNSHSVIMARSMEIPVVVDTKAAFEKVENGTMLIIDGEAGEVIIQPESAVIKDYKKKKVAYKAYKAGLAGLIDKPTISADGCRVQLTANIGAPEDIDSVFQNGGEGIGLYRTELLYMGRDQLPTEEEQFAAYKKVLERMEGKPVVIRTLDVGGDKELPYLDLPQEMNPFLGFRAIRLCLEMKDMFRTQLRALLRASAYGNLKLMFPMIATLGEFREAKAIVLQEKETLQQKGTSVSHAIEIGMMVEIPSAAVMAESFAKEADFFSIGTNDLIQYTLAADRMNERISYLHEPYNPAVLRLIKMVIDAAHKEGKRAGMCGEMAGTETAIPILLGLGLDEFSMSASSILPARKMISRLSQQEISKSIEQVLQMDTAEEIEGFVKSRFLDS